MIYIAGPLTNDDPIIQAVNIDRAQRAYYALLHVGLHGICPHLSGLDARAFQVNYDRWIANGLAQLDACEEVWLLPGWHLSNGALLELARARKNQMPVYHTFVRVCDAHGKRPDNHWWRDIDEYTLELPA